MKIRPVGAELFHEGGRKDEPTVRRTDMTKLIVAFRNFVNAPKNSTFCPHCLFYLFCMYLRTNSDYFPIQH